MESSSRLKRLIFGALEQNSNSLEEELLGFVWSASLYGSAGARKGLGYSAGLTLGPYSLLHNGNETSQRKSPLPVLTKMDLFKDRPKEEEVEEGPAMDGWAYGRKERESD